MKERVLRIGLDRAVRAFAGKKWKHYTVDDEAKHVRIESRIGTDESYIVELPFKSDQERKNIVTRLESEDFFEQEIRIVST